MWSQATCPAKRAATLPRMRDRRLTGPSTAPIGGPERPSKAPPMSSPKFIIPGALRVGETCVIRGNRHFVGNLIRRFPDQLYAEQVRANPSVTAILKHHGWAAAEG